MINLEFIPFKLTKNFIENKKENKYIELLEEDQNKVFNLIKNHLKDSEINSYENDFSKNIFNNQSYKGKNLLKEEEKTLELEKETKNKIESDNFEFEIIPSPKSEIFKEKNENFNFIKDFIFTLVIEKTESKKNEETDTNKEKKDFNNIDEDERLKYNAIFVRFMDLIDISNENKFEYLDFFIKYLTINRAKGLFQLNPIVYQILINIFKYILTNYKNSYDYVKNIILLAQTFYKGDDNNSDDKKIYLLNGLKNHDAFNEPETWHRAINYNLSLSIKNNRYCLNITNKEEYMKNLDKIVMNTIISYLYDMKASTTDTNVYENIKHFYSKIYKLDEKMLDEQVNLLYTDYNQKDIQKNDLKNIMEEDNDKINEDKK